MRDLSSFSVATRRERERDKRKVRIGQRRKKRIFAIKIVQKIVIDINN